MSDWMFEAATTTQPTGWDDPTMTSTLISTGAEPWVVGPSPGVDGDATWMDDSKGALNAFDLILFGAPEDEDATPVDDVEVTHPGDVEEDWWVPIDTGGDGPPGDDGFGPDDGGGGTDDDCPWDDFYGDAARVVGLFAGVLGALKDSPFTFDPRDDRAIERALIGIDSIEMMLQSQTLDFTTLSTVLASSIEILLSEGTDHLAAVLGAMAGGAVAGFLDGPIPVGEVLGGIAGALTVYLAGDELPHDQIASRLTKLILSGVDLPPDAPGWGCS